MQHWIPEKKIKKPKFTISADGKFLKTSSLGNEGDTFQKSLTYTRGRVLQKASIDFCDFHIFLHWKYYSVFLISNGKNLSISVI